MLTNKKVIAIVNEGYHHLELLTPIQALQDAGATVIVAGVKPEHITVGVSDHLSYKLPAEQRKELIKLKADKLINEVDAAEFDALLLPGGHAPGTLRIIPEVLGLVKTMYARKKTIGAICHGPQILISAGLVKGKDLTCAENMVDDLINAGAIYLDEPLVIDGNLISSRTPGDLTVFSNALVAALQ